MLLSMHGITRRFPGVVALSDVDLELAGGEVLALMGENGAGKSTLMKILGGAIRPNEGELLIEGKPVDFHRVADAQRAGIALIHQELMPVPNIDVAGNIFLGREARRMGMIDRAAMRRRARDLLQRVGLNLPPHTPMSTLTAGQTQMVEIAKALAQNSRIIIMDEPTSSLTLGEARQLFRIIGELRNSGVGIIYISHRLDEVLEVADRITVLRDGRYVGDLDAKKTTHDQIVSMMVGRSLSAWFPEKADRPPDEIALEAKDLLLAGTSEGVSFTVRRGEILGFAGLVGAGRTELMQVLFGIDRAIGGQMRLGGMPFDPRSPKDAIRRGVYLAPEDRKRHGLVLPMSVAQNVSLPNIGNYKPRGWLNRRAEDRVAALEVQRMRIKTPGVRQKVVNLSGGNQQKVVLGKWLAMKPTVLILDEPTRGVDVGAKAEIYRHMAALAADGIAIIMVSSDMEEILGMSDRVVVMHERRIRSILPGKQLSQERVAMLMTGGELGALAGALESDS